MRVVEILAMSGFSSEAISAFLCPPKTAAATSANELSILQVWPASFFGVSSSSTYMCSCRWKGGKVLPALQQRQLLVCWLPM